MKNRWIMIALACAATGLSAQTRVATLQPCTPGSPPDYGFESIDCINCEISARGQPWIVFHTPPVVRGIRDGGPAAGKLQEGDTLVAIDGLAMTTREAAVRYAGAAPGDTVEFRVRRGSAAVTVRVVAGLRCTTGRAAFTWSARPLYFGADSHSFRAVRLRADSLRLRFSSSAQLFFNPRRVAWRVTPLARAMPLRDDSTAAEPGWIGIGLFRVITTTERLRSGDTVGAAFSALPEIAAVAPGSPADSAGIVAGDTLFAVDGMSILTAAGAQRFLNAPAGVPITITVRRARGIVRVTLVPKEPPDTPPAASYAPARQEPE